MSNIYKGFSSENFKRKRTFRLNDVDLVKRDLLNHIFTSRNERIMMSRFGTRIKSLIFEQMTDIAIEIVENDLREVFEYDPRVQLVALQVVPYYDQNIILAAADLNFIELDLRDRMDIRIEFEDSNP